MTLNHLSAYILLICIFPVFYAYLRVLPGSSDIVRRVAISVLCMVGAAGLRTIYWDILPQWFGDDWRTFARAIGGIRVNILFHGIFIYGLVSSIHVLHLMVPDEERKDWPSWKAWWYPPRRRRVPRDVKPDLD